MGGLALAAPAPGATIEVPGDSNTIQGAVDIADPGDTIAVSKKRNNENVVVPVADLTIKGVAKGVVIDGFIDGSGNGYNVSALADGVKVQNVELRHGNGFYCSFDRCTATKVTWTGHDGSDCFTAVGNGASLRDSKLRGCAGRGVEITGDDARITGNRIERVSLDCIEVTGGDAVISNNSLSGCDDGAGIQIAGGSALIEENTAQAVQDGFVYALGNGTEVHDNRGVSSESYCYYLGGPQGSVTGNAGRHCGSDGIVVAGDSLVEDNRIANVHGEGVNTAGNNVRILNNRIAETIDYGVRSTGQQPTVNGNTVAKTGEYNVYVSCATSCADASISRNIVNGNVEGDYGLRVDIAPGSGSVAIVRNEISRISDRGLFLSGNDASVKKNTVKFSAFQQEPAFHIDGNANTLTGNAAITNGGDGFFVDGNENEFRRNDARDNDGDGFFVGPGSTDNVFEANAAVKNKADGFENDGAATDFLENEASGNRRDCANDGTLGTVEQNQCADGSDFTLPGTASR